ncbi:MAG: sigma-70 family RNA polymerase sigma factor [Thermoguttaceae bacterium]|nr:sigma-70 family RNA polymerase sigma factor [Thermoguttaceae bacterium]
MEREPADSEIQARLAANDPSALELIWDGYGTDLFAFLASLLGRRHEAEDALQDVFVTIARKRQSVAGARLLKPYLFRLARNVALNRLKRNRRVRQPTGEGFDWLVYDQPDEQGDDRTARLGPALAALPEKQRVVIVLKFFRDKTLREIGELMGTSENTAASRYRYGMAALRKLMWES